MERLLVYDDPWIGEPLIRDDEKRRAIAQTTKRQTSSSQSRGEKRRVIAKTTKRQPSSQSLHTGHHTILAEFTALFVLGMFIGAAAVLIAFML